MKYLIQKVQIFIFNFFAKFSKNKNILFSKFMSNHDIDYILKNSKIGNCLYLLNVHDIGVSRRIYIGMDDEHLKTIKAIAWIKKYKGETINTLFDIGANLGHISLPLIKEKLITKAFMWEPDIDNFKLLQCNILLNNCKENTIVFNEALGEKEETVMLELSNDNFGDHRIRVTNEKGAYSEQNRSLIECKQRPLDYFISENIDIKSLLVWIDVQGFEAKVLLGAKKLLALKPALVFEYWPYGLHRAGGINGLCDILIEYKNWTKLNLDSPDPQPISELESLYIKYQNDDKFQMDILFF